MAEAKAQFSIKDAKGNIFHLLDTHADPSWYDVVTVEERRAPCGTLQSVVNHREKSFEQRRAELRTELRNDGVDLKTFGGTYPPKQWRKE